MKNKQDLARMFQDQEIALMQAVQDAQERFQRETAKLHKSAIEKGILAKDETPPWQEPGWDLLERNIN